MAVGKQVPCIHGVPSWQGSMVERVLSTLSASRRLIGSMHMGKRRTVCRLVKALLLGAIGLERKPGTVIRAAVVIISTEGELGTVML